MKLSFPLALALHLFVGFFVVPIPSQAGTHTITTEYRDTWPWDKDIGIFSAIWQKPGLKTKPVCMH